MKMYRPRVAGLTRIRNESLIIKETLDHFSMYCDAGIYVYDDCSTDNTVKICKRHKNVKGIITGEEWDLDRERAEWQNRQAVFDFAKEKDNDIDWFVYFDADERMYFDMNSKQMKKYDAIAMMLVDAYITEEDKDRKYAGNLPMLRQQFGPEYRAILMMFKNVHGLKWHLNDQREVTLPVGVSVLEDGIVRHYGKAISIKQWEATCDYYIKHFPKYSAKWKKRKGKAVHMLSDSGRPLVDLIKLQEYAIKLGKDSN